MAPREIAVKPQAENLLPINAVPTVMASRPAVASSSLLHCSCLCLRSSCRPLITLLHRCCSSPTFQRATVDARSLKHQTPITAQALCSFSWPEPPPIFSTALLTSFSHGEFSSPLAKLARVYRQDSDHGTSTRVIRSPDPPAIQPPWPQGHQGPPSRWREWPARLQPHQVLYHLF